MIAGKIAKKSSPALMLTRQIRAHRRIREVDDGRSVLGREPSESADSDKNDKIRLNRASVHLLSA